MTNRENNLLRPFDLEGLEILDLDGVTSGASPRRRFDVVFATRSAPDLERASGWLKPGGALILAAENRVGLRFWNGSAETASGRLFEGISGGNTRVFSRREWLEKIHRAGFSQVDEFFAFPDLQAPSALVSRRLWESSPELVTEIAASPTRPGNLFPASLAWHGLTRAGLFDELANGFVFVACAEPDCAIRLKLLSRLLSDGQYGWHYSLARRLPTQTIFRLNGAEVTVEKKPLASVTPSTLFHDPLLGNLRWQALPAETVVTGESVRTALARRAYVDDWRGFHELLSAYLTWALQEWTVGEVLRGEALDAIFVNATIRNASEFRVFDLEWRAEAGVPKSWFLFRNVYNLVRDEALLTENSGYGSFASLYERLCREQNVTPELDKDLEREAKLQAITSSEADPEIHLAALQTIFRRPLPRPVLPRDPQKEAVLRGDVARLVEENADLKKLLESLPHRITEKIRRGLKRVPLASQALHATVAPAYQLAKQTRRRLREGRPRAAVPVARESGVWEVPRGAVQVPSGGFARILVRGRFRGVASAELLVRFRAENDALATMRVPLSIESRTLARVILRDPGEVDGLSVALAPSEGGKVTAVHVQPLSRWRAVSELCLPVAKRFLTEPVEAGGFALDGARLLRPGKGRHFKLWLKEELFKRSVPPADIYSAWIDAYDTLSDDDVQAIRERIRELPELPLISVVVPVYNTDERWLRAAIDSVVNQLYPNWELCLADDCSPAPHVRRVLEEYRLKDPRIRVAYRKKNGHISAASNTALELASGEFVALLDHDDELAPHALYVVAEELRRHPRTDLIYSDEDKIDGNGRRYSPHFKPDWNPELFYSLNLVTHLSVFRTSILREIGGFRLGYEGSQDYDLTLRFLERTSAERIRHIPHVLYHWRAIPGSVALASDEKNYAHEAARKAIRSHLERTGVDAEVVEGFPPLHRVKYRLPDPLPKVSVIIGTRDRKDLLESAVRGVLEKTDYPNLELVIVDNQSQDPKTLDYFRSLMKDPRVRVLRYDAPFNFSAINNFAAEGSQAPLLLFLNNDIEVIEPGWLKEMVAFAVRPEIGAVGAKLLYRDGRVQHAGIVLGIGGVADHVHRFYPQASDGYFGRAAVTMSFSAVTAACLLMRREVFREIGGFDAEHLAVAYNDVDLCLRIREKGLRIVHTPFAQLYHLESASRGSDQDAERQARFRREFEWMRERWGEKLDRDPAYNPNLSLAKVDFSLAFPPRVTKPWRELPLPENPLSSSITPTAETASLESPAN